MRTKMMIAIGITVIGNSYGSQGAAREAAPAFEQSEGSLERMHGWMRGWWRKATPEQRIWAEVQMRRSFPEMGEHLAGHDDRR